MIARSFLRKAAVKANLVQDSVTLDFKARAVQHAHFKTDKGALLDVELEALTVLNDGDGLVVDGQIVVIKAATQPLLEVSAHHAARLLKAAYLLGSNHVAVEVAEHALYVEETPLNADLVRGSGCGFSAVLRPFQPEKALHHPHDCGHDHHHHH